MLGHDFTDMPRRSMEIWDNPHETVMLLRCRWCMKTPTKAREGGCPIHELEENGIVRLDEYNPKGLERFMGRKCITCGEEIMLHWLIKDANSAMNGFYWCNKEGDQFSEGIDNCIYDVQGIKVPEERRYGSDKE